MRQPPDEWQQAADIVRAAGLEAPAAFLEHYRPRPPWYWQANGCRCTIDADGLVTHDCPAHAHI